MVQLSMACTAANLPASSPYAQMCSQATAQVAVYGQSADYYGLWDNGPVLPTQINPIYTAILTICSMASLEKAWALK